MGRWVECGFLLLGLTCAGWSVVSWLDAVVYQVAQGQRLDRLLSTGAREEREFPNPRAALTADTAEVDDRLIGRIEIPRLGLSAIVAEGVDTGTLRRAVGHDPGTALPGRPGNVVLAGHRDTFFRALRAVRPLDLVTITTPDGVFDYQVDEVSIVDADRLDIVAPAAEPMLTLITCYPFHFVGPAPRRFIVHARPAVARQSAARDGVTERHERATGLPVARRSS